LGLILLLPLVLRVIHASSKAVSKTTRVSGSKDPLPIPSMFPLHDLRLGNNVFEPPLESSRIFEITRQFARVACNKITPPTRKLAKRLRRRRKNNWRLGLERNRPRAFRVLGRNPRGEVLCRRTCRDARSGQYHLFDGMGFPLILVGRLTGHFRRHCFFRCRNAWRRSCAH